MERSRLSSNFEIIRKPERTTLGNRDHVYGLHTVIWYKCIHTPHDDAVVTHWVEFRSSINGEVKVYDDYYACGKGCPEAIKSKASEIFNEYS